MKKPRRKPKTKPKKPKPLTKDEQAEEVIQRHRGYTYTGCGGGRRRDDRGESND